MPNPPAVYPNRVVVLQDKAKSFTVTITPALWERGDGQGPVAQTKETILQVIFSGQQGMTLQSLIIGTVLYEPSYVVLDPDNPNSFPSQFITQSPLLLTSGGFFVAQEPTPIPLADGSSTRWDFSQFSGGASNPLNLVFDGFPSEFQGIDIFPNINPLTPQSFSSSNFLAIVRDSSNNILMSVGSTPPATAPAALNDLSSSPTSVTALPFKDFIDTSATNPQEILSGNNAGGEINPQSDPAPPCSPASSRVFRSVWYKFTATSSGLVHVSTDASRFDTLVYVYPVNQPQPTYCDDDGNAVLLSSDLNFQAVSGTQYYIMVSECPPPVGVDQNGNPAAIPLSNDATLYLSLSYVDAAPAIDSVLPASAVPGTTIPQITLYGANFPAQNAVVQFNGSNLTPSFVSPGKIVVSNILVPAKTATVPISVVNPNANPEIGRSNSILFPVTTSPAVNFGTSPTSLIAPVFTPIAVDLNNDGKTDIIFSDTTFGFSDSGDIVVALGNGDGTFQPPTYYGVSGVPSSIVVGDFNGDGKPDIAVAAAETFAEIIQILWGNGDGTFQAQPAIFPGVQDYFLATGDFNGDGLLDLVLLNGLSRSQTLSVMLAQGTGGTFAPPVTYPAGSELSYLLTGDFNDDGILDLAVLNNGGPSGSNTVSVLLGVGDGTFQQPLTAITGVSPVSAAAADFNGDGKLDLAVVNQTDGTMSVLLGNGDGTFEPKVDYPAATANGAAVAVGDLNGDGKLDLLVSGTGNGFLLLPGRGDGTFQTPAVSFVEPNQPYSAVLGDFNNDGHLDAVAPDANGFDVFVQQVPSVSLSPTNLIFLPQAVATTSASQPLMLTNTGTALLTITSIAGAGDFRETDNCIGQLAIGASCKINVNFTPDNVGTETGAITISDSASITPQIVDLTGRGIVPLSVSPSGLSFGSVTVGKTSAPQTVTLTNNASFTLSTNISASGNYAAVGSGSNPCGATLAAGKSCGMSVTFTPTANGTINGAITIADNTAVKQQEVTLSGSGTGGPASPLTFSPTTLTFPSQAFATQSPAQVVTLKNVSGASVKISAITSTGNFSATGTSSTPCQGGTVLAANGTCKFNVIFTPTFLSTIKGAIVISDNSKVGQQVLGVSGTGVLPVVFSPTNITFGTQNVGTTSAPQPVTLINNLSTTLTNIQLMSSGDFAIVNNTCGSTLAAHSQCSFMVTFTPTQVGNIIGAVSGSDSAITRQMVSLSGTGH